MPPVRSQASSPRPIPSTDPVADAGRGDAVITGGCAAAGIATASTGPAGIESATATEGTLHQPPGPAPQPIPPTPQAPEPTAAACSPAHLCAAQLPGPNDCESEGVRPSSTPTSTVSTPSVPAPATPAPDCDPREAPMRKHRRRCPPGSPPSPHPPMRQPGRRETGPPPRIRRRALFRFRVRLSGLDDDVRIAGGRRPRSGRTPRTGCIRKRHRHRSQRRAHAQGDRQSSDAPHVPRVMGAECPPVTPAARRYSMTRTSPGWKRSRRRATCAADIFSSGEDAAAEPLRHNYAILATQDSSGFLREIRAILSGAISAKS